MRRQSAKLTRDGQPVTWIGVNFWSRSGGPRMWTRFDPDVVRAELITMRDFGMPLTRSFFYWPDFMPGPDRIDEDLVARYRQFLDLHAELGLTTIPTFIVGHMSGENWDPAWRDGRDLYADVWMVGRQAWFVRELTTRFAAHPAVAGWLLSNEMPIYAHERTGGHGENDHATVAAWAQILIDAVRAGGGTQPVSIGDGVWGLEISGSDNGYRVRELAPLIDFHGPHVYRMENDPVRQHLAAAYICELLDIGGKPVVVEEFGLSSDYVSGPHAAAYYRQVLHQTLLAGATGWLCWNNTDYDDLADQAPYAHHPFEMHFGVTDRTGEPKPPAYEMRAFADLAAEIGFERLNRPDASAAIVVSSFLEAQYPFTDTVDAGLVLTTTRQAYLTAKEADLPIGVAREADGLPDGVDLFIVPSTKALLAPTWRALAAAAERGATVYASYFVGDHGPQRGLWWPGADEMFGVRKQTRYGLVDLLTDPVVEVTFASAFGGIAAGETLTIAVDGPAGARSYLPVEAESAEVLATDQHGRPVLLRHRAGAGAMILGTVPFEYFAAVRPEVNPEPTWRIYDALATEAGIDRPVRVEDPRVMCAELVRDDGVRYVWLVSQSPEPLEVMPSCEGTLTARDGTAVESVKLAPYGVEILIRTQEAA